MRSIPVLLLTLAPPLLAPSDVERPPRIALEPAELAPPATVRAIPGAWLVERPALVPLPGGPAIARAARASGAFTLTAWLHPEVPLVAPGVPQPVSARLIAFGTDERSRNLALDVTTDGELVSVAWFVRTTASSDEGSPRHSASFPDPGQPFLLALVREPDGTERVAVDGREVAARPRPGSLANWDERAELCLFGERGAYRPWRGALHHLTLAPGATWIGELAALAARGPEVPEVGWLDTEPQGPLGFEVAGEHIAGDTHVALLNRGSAPLLWSAALADGPAWCTLAGPTSGQLAPGARATLRFGVERSVLPAEGARSAAVLQLDVESLGATSRLERPLMTQWSPAGEGWPTTADTGPARPPLTARGAGFTVRTAGAVLECVSVDGPLLIDADDVLLRDLTIDAGAARFGLRIAPGRKNVRIERVHVRGGREATLVASGAWLTDVRVEAGPGHGALLGGDVSLQRVWIHAEGPGPAAVAVLGGEGIDLIEVRVDASPERAAAVALEPKHGAVRAVSIERAWLGGGEVTLLASDGHFGPPEGVTLLGNRFTAPPVAAAIQAAGSATWRAVDNRFAATGSPVSLR